MTPHQVHAKTKKAIRLARQLRDACNEASGDIADHYGSHTDISASARRALRSTELTLSLVSDVFCQTGDVLLKGVSK